MQVCSASRTPRCAPAPARCTCFFQGTAAQASSSSLGSPSQCAALPIYSAPDSLCMPRYSVGECSIECSDNQQMHISTQSVLTITNAECSINFRLLQILTRPSISFTTVTTACAQCKYSLRDENHDFDDSNQIWPAGARARCGKTFKN